jgi:spore maturation protein B
LNILSKIVIPLFVVFVVFYGFTKKVNIYDAFLDGAKEGLQISLSVFPNVVAMVFAINIFLDSNFVYEILSVFEGFLMKVNIPLDILPMAKTLGNILTDMCNPSLAPSKKESYRFTFFIKP